MKKTVILTLVFGLFLISCQKSDKLTDNRSGQNAAFTPADTTCTNYSIFNPHAPMGPSVEYYYLNCNGQMQTGWIDPRETIFVVAKLGSVKCPGGVVTQM